MIIDILTDYHENNDNTSDSNYATANYRSNYDSNNHTDDNSNEDKSLISTTRVIAIRICINSTIS